MKALKVFVLGLFLFYAGVSYAMENVVSWGGPGGDNTNGSRFSAQKSQRQGVDAVDIICDLGDENQVILEVHLVDDTGAEAIGSECWALERHITSPVACVVDVEDLGVLSGQGKIKLLNRNKALIAEEAVDLEAVKGVLN